MIANKMLIEDMCSNFRVEPNKMLVTHILNLYGHEPLPNVWSEQDLFEQIRKIILRYSKDGILTSSFELNPILKERVKKLSTSLIDF